MFSEYLLYAGVWALELRDSVAPLLGEEGVTSSTLVGEGRLIGGGLGTKFSTVDRCFSNSQRKECSGKGNNQCEGHRQVP